MFEHIEKLQREYTDKYVVVDTARPELRRFKGLTGTIKTINMNGRALVEFDGNNNIGWYDIELPFLKVIDAPLPKPDAKAKKPEAKPAAEKPAAKPAAAAAPAASGKPSVADILAAARSGGKAPAAAPAPVEEPAAEEPAEEPVVAAPPAAAPAASGSGGSMKDKFKSVDEIAAYCRKTDAK